MASPGAERREGGTSPGVDGLRGGGLSKRSPGDPQGSPGTLGDMACASTQKSGSSPPKDPSERTDLGLAVGSGFWR